ncbi:MAG: nuclease-related domain-containing protein [Tepidisphaeraceae bacterium]
MAITYDGGKAGQHAKRTAFQHSKRIIWLSMFGVLAAGTLLGFIVAAYLQWLYGPFGWMRAHVILFAALEGTLGFAVIFGLRGLDKHADRLAVERIKWLRGGQGEALVAWYLNDLPSTWHVFHNVKLWKDGDLDHVLIGPGGLFCISTKANRGLYTAAPDGKYLLNGEETNHIHEAQRLAMQLKDRLTGILGAVRWIQPVLIAPIAYIGFQTFQDRAWVLHEGNLRDIFLDEAHKFNTAEIERYAKAVKMIVDGASDH